MRGILYSICVPHRMFACFKADTLAYIPCLTVSRSSDQGATAQWGGRPRRAGTVRGVAWAAVPRGGCVACGHLCRVPSYDARPHARATSHPASLTVDDTEGFHKR